MQDYKPKRLMIFAFYLAAGIWILSFAALLGTGLYLQAQRPLAPDIANGFVFPTKIVSGVVYLGEADQMFLKHLSLLSFFSFLCTFSLKVLSKK